jgi:TonB-linked SusC/RagA family outer membrane protein
METKIHLRVLCALLLLLSSFALFGQRSVTGTVLDENSQALPGVNVIVKGTTTGAITDAEGNFTIEAPDDPETVIAFSFVGYSLQEITLGTQTTLNIAMEPDFVGLDEVVVVGYGTVKKSDITGSLSSVTDEMIKEMPVTNINQAIQGRAAGVDVVNASYGLNTHPEIRIRGNRSIKADNDPLYVIDGVPIVGSIHEISAGDIESIEILKDASATAIYGSRGANGVVLVTTKRGQSGQYAVNFESSASFTNALRFFDQLTGDEWMEIARDNRRTARRYYTPYPNPDDDYAIVRNMHYNVWESVEMGYQWNEDGTVAMRPVTDDERERWSQVMDVVPDEVPLYNPEDVRTYDWFSEGRNDNALTQNHLFSVSGGTDRLSTYLSLGYIDEHGQGVGERYQRISPRLNVDFQVTDWLKIGMSSTFNSELADYGEGLLWGVTSMLPVSLPYDSTGTFLINPTNDVVVVNPLRDEELNTREDRVNRYLGAYFAEISFTQHLRYKLNVSQDFRHWRRGRYQHALSSDRYPSVNWTQYNQSQQTYYSIENLLFYNRQFGKHSLGVTLLQSVEANRFERTDMEGQNYPYDSQLWYNMNSTLDPSTLTLGSEYRRSQLASFMGRVNYSFMDRYLLTASLRYDGSSKFYVDNQWDYFPSFSLAWKVNEESFLSGVSALSQLKLRFGYGTVGQSGTDPYETAGRIQESLYVFGDDPAKGYSPELIQTKDVGWEKTSTMNVGIDFGLYRNRVSGTLELYRANTHDLLLDKSIPAITGYESVRANVGKTRNEGIEFTLNTFNVDRGGFRWETDFTFTTNREQILELAEGAEDDILNEWFIGYPIRSYYTYQYEGIWQEKDSTLIDHYNATGNNGFAPGKIRVADTNGDDTINTNDRIVVGHNVPKFSGGLTNRLYYKGFELSFFFFFRVGHGIYSRDAHYMTHTARYATPFKVNYYRPMGTEEENADAEHPAPANTRDRYESALWYREASFLKLRHVTLSYDVPKSVLARAKIKSLRLSIQAFNPLLITDYPFLDPEAQNDDVNRTPGGSSGKGWTFSVKLGI